MTSYFTSLWHYTGWANAKLLEALQATPHEKGCALMNHIIAAQELWLSRVNSAHTTDWQLFESRPVDECITAAQESNDAWLDFLAGCAESSYAKPLSYADLRGRTWTQPLECIIAHVVNHGGHHRGQVALLLRAAGHVPPVTDYIAFLCEKA